MQNGNVVNVFDLQKKYVMPTYSPGPLMVRGEGMYLWDHEGRRYLDFGSGIGVCNLGHCHPAVTKAIQKQAEKLMHVSNLYLNENQPRLAEKLVMHGFDGVVFFANSGAEANEGIIKFARKWGSDKGRHEIIAMKDSFHGRTLATLAATGRDKYRKGFAPDMPGFKFATFNDIDSVKDIVDDNTAAILVEPVQGEGGVVPATPEFLQGLRDLCDEKGILLLFDEVQCGMGRTGFFFAWQSYKIQPDALSLAKALGNGFPIGAFIVRREYAETLTAGTHASTFGGTPIACAAANAVIDAIHFDKILVNCLKQSHFIKDKLKELKSRHACVKEVRGRGLMIGIELDRQFPSLLSSLRDKGLIALTAGENVLRLLPPLIVTKEEVETAVNIIDETLSELETSEKEEQ
jgi:predicted acetylornithine/succinylornithine family transaminase